jgi:leucyl aminopeptidase
MEILVFPISFGMRQIKMVFEEAIPYAPDVAIVSVTDKKENEVIKLATGQKSIAVGAGEADKMTRRKLILLIRRIITLAKANKIRKLAVRFQDFDFPNIDDSKRDVAELMAINFEMANFAFNKYKTKPDEGWNHIDEIAIVTGFKDKTIQAGIKVGQIIGTEVNHCRELSNTPGGEMTPSILAQSAKTLSKGLAIDVKILGRKEMKRLKMGGVLGVAQGSREEPKFIIMEYFGGDKALKPIVLVGKGVTFDSGGLNVKPGDAMLEMHMDMSGGAAVIHAIIAAARLGYKQNVVGIIPAVENMPSGDSYRPQDILRTMNGKTIEVLNTDAEGRIVLADGLEYAKRYKPRLVVDIATLTGAAVVALGQHASALFATDDETQKVFRELGEESGDYIWPMPLWEEYEEDIKGTFGDVSNTGKSRYGGSISAAVFLWQFIKGYSWVHIDIASRISSIEGEHLSKGAAGAPVRLLVKLLERV